MSDPHSTKVFKRRTLATAISIALSSLAYGEERLVLEEVIVTATKREVSLQNVPQAVTAFTTADIQRQGLMSMDDYVLRIPSLSMSRRQPGGTSLSFRGIAASGIQFNANASAGVYLDEQPITSAGLNPDPRLIDIERVEALSGPQGTLFGEASQSGTLRIITNKPDTAGFEGWVEGGAAYVEDSDDQDYDFSAMVNIPLVEDKLALRLVGFTGEEAGYIDNIFSRSQADTYGRPGRFTNADQVDDDVNSSQSSGGRAALRWEINDNWRLDVGAIFQTSELDGFTDTNPGPGVGDREQIRFSDETSEDDWYQLSLTLEGSMDWADTILVGSYFERDFEYTADVTDYQHDFDQKYDPAYYLVYDFGGHPRGTAFSEEKDKRWTLEGRLSTPADSDSRWHGLVGFYYGKTERETKFTSVVNGLADTYAFTYLNYYAAYYSPSLNGSPPGTWTGSTSDGWYGSIYDTEIEQIAVFGEATLDITEDLSITAGGRWFDIDRTFDSLQTGLTQGKWASFEDDYVTIDDVVKTSEDDFSPKLTLTYQITDDNMLYGTYSEGFRAGGGNAVRASSVLPRQYDSDTVENFEIGSKNTLLDGRLNLNAVAYFMTWDDIQIQANDPNIFALGYVNFPEAEITGVELEFSWLMTQGLLMSGGYSYVDATISKDSQILGDDGSVVAEVTDGTQLPISPEHKGNLSLDYTFQASLWGMEPHMRLDYVYVGESLNSLAGTESIVFTREPTKQDSYSLVNFRAGMSNENWDLTLYADNLTDEVAEQFYNNRYGSRQRLSINKPRTIGFSARYKF